MARGGHLVIEKRYFRTEGDYKTSQGGLFLELKGVIKSYDKVLDEETGESTRVEALTTHVVKNRWYTIFYPYEYSVVEIFRPALMVAASKELVKHGQVRVPALLEKNEQIHLRFRPDANMDLADLDSHFRVMIMEAVG